jgi:hypothetical protein
MSAAANEPSLQKLMKQTLTTCLEVEEERRSRTNLLLIGTAGATLSSLKPCVCLSGLI